MEKEVNEIKKREYPPNELLYDVCNAQRMIIKNMKSIIITLVICFCIVLTSMIIGFFWYESQFEVIDSETTTTTMQTDGDNANINNVTDGNMYNDNAIHNEGVDN